MPGTVKLSAMEPDAGWQKGKEERGVLTLNGKKSCR